VNGPIVMNTQEKPDHAFAEIRDETFICEATKKKRFFF